MLNRVPIFVFLIILLLGLVYCSEDGTEEPVGPGPDTGDTLIDISGITTALDNGAVMSAEDDDWCYSGASPRPLDVLPVAYALYPAYPNPSWAQVMVQFDLPVAGDVHMYVIDSTETILRDVINEAYPAGRFTTYWDRTDNAGGEVPLGMYRLVMEAGDFTCYGDISLIPLFDTTGDPVTVTCAWAAGAATVSYSCDDDVAALLLVFSYAGTVGSPNFYPVAADMTTASAYLNDNFRILIIPPVSQGAMETLASGTHQLCQIPSVQPMKLLYVEAADATGSFPVKTYVVNAP